eukprot:153621-Pelagomonas_calceolata.AAC.3
MSPPTFKQQQQQQQHQPIVQADIKRIAQIAVLAAAWMTLDLGPVHAAAGTHIATLKQVHFLPLNHGAVQK